MTSHLDNEARYLHAALFARLPDARTIERYAAAHAALFPEAAQSPLLRTVLTRSLDAEAVEAALRRRSGSNLLTRKMQVLCYVVEIEPEYRAIFHNTRRSRVRAWLGLCAAALRGSWKLAKGSYLIKRHGLA